MTRNFDIDALRTMVVGVEMESFTRAASHLGRSQSAVSMQIKKLENRAGKPLFIRQGRGLVPTEAGEKLLVFARKIIALNDEAAIALGVGEAESGVRLGLPQDFFDVVLPQTIEKFSAATKNVHVDVRAGRNFALEEEVYAGRLDAAIVFFPEGSRGHGELLARLPTYWLAAENSQALASSKKLPLVLYHHPCLFRTTALKALESGNRHWRIALTTPSLQGVWAALHARQGITLRTLYQVPKGVRQLPADLNLPPSDPVELRLIVSRDMSPAAKELCAALRATAFSELAPFDTRD